MIMAKQKTLEEQFSNEGTFTPGEQQQVNQENYFRYFELEVVRKRYLKMTVFMEILHEVLELPFDSSGEQFMIRIGELITAAKRES